MRKNEKITALYERLSRDDFGKDDDQQRESNSISNQKAMLEEFAARQGFTNIVHFTDDGISGTCFDRPGFLAMMKEVEAGNVEYLCIKDMSRMGRDYLKVGQIMEILRQRGVRLIAINDGVDSARGDDDFTPFRNIMNEYYARDTSRKIRSTFQSKGKSGKHLTGTVIYGYLWNEARDQWLVDPEAAEVVKRIFSRTSLSARPTPSDTTADFARRIWKCTARYCSMSWYYPTNSLSIAPKLTQQHETAWS